MLATPESPQAVDTKRDTERLEALIRPDTSKRATPNVGVEEVVNDDSDVKQSVQETALLADVALRGASGAPNIEELNSIGINLLNLSF